MMKKEKVYADNNYPLNNLDDRRFEELIFSIFKKRLEGNENKIRETFDSIDLMPGVAEQGKDCVLYKGKFKRGVIQCKKYKTNLSEKQIIKEFLKFSIYRTLASEQYSIKVIYYFVASTGYTQKALNAIKIINNGNIEDLCDLKLEVETIISTTKFFRGKKFDEIKDQLISTIKNTYIESPIYPTDISIWLTKYTDVTSQFFDVKKVIVSEQSHELDNDINTFKENYYKVAKTKFSEINFIGLDLKKGRNVPTDISLEDIYVNPLFKKVEFREIETQSINNRSLDFSKIFISDKNIVILGEPGAGKSLFVKNVILKIINKKFPKLKDSIPFRIELRKYNEVRGKKSIIEYLSDIFKTEYQVDVSTLTLIDLFSNKKTTVFFDGFDEIFNKKHKEAIKSCIDAFSAMYSDSRCIVTSRFIGYHEMRFNNKQYDEFSIQHFNNSQINELVAKFYKTQYKSIDRQEKHAKESLEQIAKNVDEELKQNPLILTLILILINNNIAIPDSKLEIYESCTKTLVDTIDSKEKELQFEIPVKNKRAAFDYLGYWQYKQSTDNITVNYEKSKQALSQYFFEKKESTEYPDCETKAEKFLEYAEKRSIYFENNFTHKTFLEYFTADYLYINHITKASDDGKKRLQNIIKDYLPNPYWYIVFELLFSLIDNSQIDNELLDEIITEQIKTNNIDVLYFFVSHIFRISNVSDSVIRNLLHKTIISCLDGKKISQRTKVDKNLLEENCIVKKIRNLQKNSRIASILQNVMTEIEESLSDSKKQINFYNLYYEIISITHNEIKNKLKIKNQKLCSVLSKNNELLFSNEIVKNEGYTDISEVIEYIELFGKDSIFKTINLKYRINIFRIDLISIYLRRNFEYSTIKKFEEDIDILIPNYFSIEEFVEKMEAKMLNLYYRTENGMTKLLDFYRKSNSQFVDQIIIQLIQVDEDTKKMYKNYYSKQESKKNAKIHELNMIFKI